MTELDGLNWPGVCGVLWSEHEALETLLFRLVQQKALLRSGNVNWLHRCDDEVRAAINEVRAAELVRSAEFDAFVRDSSLPTGTALQGVVMLAPEPWHSILDDHRGMLRELAVEMGALATANEELLRAGAAATQELLGQVVGITRDLDALHRLSSGRRGRAAMPPGGAALKAKLVRMAAGGRSELADELTTMDTTFRAALETVSMIGFATLFDFLD